MSATDGFVMCLVNRDHQLVAYLRQDWAAMPEDGPVTGAREAAWTTNNGRDTAQADSFGKLYKVGSVGARFELRPQAQCPVNIAP